MYQAGLKDEHCLFVAHTPSRNKGERKKEASVKIRMDQISYVTQIDIGVVYSVASAGDRAGQVGGC